jgi:hypothetical protein
MDRALAPIEADPAYGGNFQADSAGSISVIRSKIQPHIKSRFCVDAPAQPRSTFGY